MFKLLFILFTVIPIVELALLIQVGAYLGTFNTIILVIGTAAVGASLAKRQGLQVLSRMRASIQVGAMPAEELFDGVLVLAAGLFLITPGILTDLLGFLLLIGPTRRLIKGAIRSSVGKMVNKRAVHYSFHKKEPPHNPPL